MRTAPNILWIVTTQWRAQACGYAGDPNARTPCLDALAAESVNYTQAVTPHPFGPFARAALLTGVPSPENGICDYFDPLPNGTRTIAHELRDRGYATAFFGKWGVGRRDPRVPLVSAEAAKLIVPESERGGFEFWEGFEGGFQLNDPWLHGSRLPEPLRFEGYQAEVLAERAEGWWWRGQSDTRPWFCMVSIESPHPPYDAPPGPLEFRNPAELKLQKNVPLGGGVETKARAELAGYYAQIEATDRSVCRLLNNLRCGDTRLHDDTMVVFTSVHGDMHGAHGLFRKGWPHEESVRVPLLVRTPGESPRRDHSPISLAELPALTLAKSENRDLKTERQFARISMPSVVALPHQCDRVWRGVRTRTRKLVLNADGTPWLFFDLERDPQELKNLTADPARAGEIAALRAQM